MELKHKVVVYGLSCSVNFMRARCCAEDIHSTFPDMIDKPVMVAMLEFDWDVFIEVQKRELRREMWGFKGEVLVCVDGKPMRGANDFIAWAEKTCNFQEFRPLPLYDALTKQFHEQFFDPRKRKYVYMDIIIQGVEVGRLVFELFQDLLPKTCANFEALCTGEKGVCGETNVHLTYANSPIHRIVFDGWIQGGDIELENGKGGVSIYGRVFEDETLAVRHDKRGMLGMANRGRNTNQSQFYITLRPAPWMDGRFVAFGRVVEGVDTLKKMEQVETIVDEPQERIIIQSCGRL